MDTSKAIISALVESGFSSGDFKKPTWQRFADEFIAEAIEFGVVDAQHYIGSQVWNDAIAEAQDRFAGI